MNSTIEKAKKKLELALQITGLSMHALSKIIGVADTTLSRLRKSPNPPEPRSSTLEAIDQAVLDHIASGKATSDQMALFESEYEKGAATIVATPVSAANQKSSVEPVEIDRKHLGDYQLDPRSIPVLGTAAGSALGSFEIGSEVIDHVRRPPSLAGLKQIYAIYVVGESMVPEHNPGDLRIIHPDRPPQPGDSVVIQTYNAATDTREAFIKRLISINSHEVKVYQHNPYLEITYIRPNGNPHLNDTDDTYAIKVHKVLSMNELHGF